jgi:hypothetical protein
LKEARHHRQCGSKSGKSSKSKGLSRAISTLELIEL